jgi:hypothetical protein
VERRNLLTCFFIYKLDWMDRCYLYLEE